MINAFAFTLPVNIFQLWVNIIFGSVLKMIDWAVFIAVGLLVGSAILLSYTLGYRIGSIETWKQAKYILEDSAKIAQESFQTMWKG